MRAFIIDDEPVARRELRRLLADHPDVSITGDAASVVDARTALAMTAPDVVFLDVKLGNASGFDLLGGIPRETAVVFVTAYSEFAVDAFTANALDYLLKPVESDRLAETLRRVRERGVAGGAASRRERREHARGGGARRLTPVDWLFLEARDSRSFVRVSTITHIRAERDCSQIYLADGSVRHSGTGIGEWEAALPESLFLRVHRGVIVNLGFVKRVTPWSNYGYLLHMTATEEPVVVSRRYAAHMRKTLKRPPW